MEFSLVLDSFIGCNDATSSFLLPCSINIVPLYRVFQKELYNFESLCKFIQRTCTVFSTVII
jgi:hypothetical protein